MSHLIGSNGHSPYATRVKRIVLALSVLVLGGVGMAACGTDSPSQPVSVGTYPATTTAPATSTAAPTAAPAIAVSKWTPTEQLFIDTLTREGVQYSSEANLVNGGRATCDYLDTGASIKAASAVAINAGLSPRDAGSLIGASVAAFCPRHSDAVNYFTATHGGTR